WAGVAASAVAWGLKVFVQPLAVPPQALVAETGRAARGDLTRLLGADAPAPVAAVAPEPAADARFKLVGVVSPRSPQAAREGLALIAVDGKPPRAYRVGAVVDGAHVLQAVNPRGATLGPADGAALVALKLPPPAPAATGVLPGGSRSAIAPRPAPRTMPQVTPQLAPPQTSPLRQPTQPPTEPMVSTESTEIDEPDTTDTLTSVERDSRAPLR
ncbi:MAG TPA: type II secretion system protein N, partial [Rubrivivax sp.]|nr:type II secretion system protein N [Rubrivivax sp.]